MLSYKDKAVFLLFAYPFGIFLGLCFWLFRLSGIVKVTGWKNFPHWRGKLILASNHQSLLEPITLIGLFFHQYVFRPFKYAPWNMSDAANYYNNGLFRLMRGRLISVDRANRVKAGRAIVKAIQVLDSGGIIIIFPEGGRTCRGDQFVLSRQGHKLRPLTPGLAELVKKTGALVLPVWVEGTDKVLVNTKKISYWPFRFWKKVSVRLGEPIYFSGMEAEDITETVQRNLLKLADQES